jgi:hypothetical protein
MILIIIINKNNFPFSRFYFIIMSNKSYVVLNNSIDKLDVTIPVKEPPSKTNNQSEDSLHKRYVQIAVAVGLYWYEEI